MNQSLLRVLIIEDEPLAAQRIAQLLTGYEKAQVEVVGHVSGVAEAIDAIPDISCDLLLCDIRLGDGLSFNIWDHIAVPCPVIFTTAYEEYAIRAFKVNSVDYLLKPVEASELYTALDRFRSNFSSASAQVAKNASAETVPQLDMSMIETLRQAILQPKQYRQRLMSKVGDKLVPLAVAEVTCFVSENRISWAYLADGKRQPVNETLEQLEEILDPFAFKRINRAVIIQAEAVEQLIPYSNSRYCVSVKGYKGEPLIIARERVAEIREWLGG